MNIVEKQQLWNKLENFQFDEGFVQRLAREKNIPLSFAEKVVEEYRKFMFLCATMDTMATPSYWVDECWHLHLIYTRSYWEGICKIIGKPIHHNPGNQKEIDRGDFFRAFQTTIKAYEAQWGVKPSGSVWTDKEPKKRVWKWKAGVMNWRTASMFFILLLLTGCTDEEKLIAGVVCIFLILLIIFFWPSKGGRGGSSGAYGGGFGGCSSCGGGCGSSCGSSCGGGD